MTRSVQGIADDAPTDVVPDTSPDGPVQVVRSARLPPRTRAQRS